MIEEKKFFIPLGKSLNILFQTKHKNVESIEKLDEKSKFYFNLSIDEERFALSSFLGQFQGISFENMDSILLKLYEKLSDKNSKSLSLSFLSKIDQNILEEHIIKSLQVKDKKEKLILSSGILIHFLETKSEKGFTSLIDSFFKILKNDSVILDNKRQPTKLTCTISDCFLTLIFKNFENQEFIFQNLKTFVLYFQELEIWNETHRTIYVEGIKIIKNYIQDIEKISHRFHDKDLGIEAKYESSKFIGSILKTYIPYLYEVEKYHFIKKKEVDELINSLLMEITYLQDPSKEINEESDSKTIHCLICISLVLERYLKELPSQQIYDSISNSIHSKNENISNLSVYLMRQVLRTQVGDNTQKLCESLFFLLDQRDNASKAIKVLIADHISKNPKQIIPLIFSRIDDKVKRHNSIEILEEVFKINQQKEFKDLMTHLISDELFKRFNDEELILRTKCSNLFSYMDIEYIFPKLIQYIHHKDVKIRSSSFQSLLNLMNQNIENEAPLDILLRSIKMEMENLNEILSIIPKWVENLSTKGLGNVIQWIIEKTFKNPNDQLLIQVLSRILSYPKVPEHSEIMINIVWDYIKNNKDKDIFKMLIPILVMKPFPLECFVNEKLNTVYHNIFKYTFDMMKNENDDIKKLSAEITSRFPLKITLDVVLKSLMIHKKEGQYKLARIYLYCLTSIIMIHQGKFKDIPKILFENLDLECTNEDIYKLQYGTIDCLGILLSKDLELGKEILKKLSNEKESIQICMIHILTTSLKYMKVNDILEFSQNVMKNLLEISIKGSDKIRCASLQFLLHNTYQLKKNVFPYSSSLFKSVITSLKDKNDEIRLNGLKLFSSLLVAREELVMEHQNEMEVIQKLLVGMANIDTSISVRELSSKMVQLLFQQK